MARPSLAWPGLARPSLAGTLCRGGGLCINLIDSKKIETATCFLLPQLFPWTLASVAHDPRAWGLPRTSQRQLRHPREQQHFPIPSEGSAGCSCNFKTIKQYRYGWLNNEPSLAWPSLAWPGLARPGQAWPSQAGLTHCAVEVGFV